MIINKIKELQEQLDKSIKENNRVLTKRIRLALSYLFVKYEEIKKGKNE